MAALAGWFALIGCSSGPEIESADPSDEKLRISVPVGGIAPASSWPDACRLLTDEEITAILPQAEGITREPGSPSGRCDYRLVLSDDDLGSTIGVRVTGVGDPQLIDGRFERERARPLDGAGGRSVGFRENGAECYAVDRDRTDTSGLSIALVCHQGPMMFEVSGRTGAELEAVSEFDDPNDVWHRQVLPEVAKTIAAKID